MINIISMLVSIAAAVISGLIVYKLFHVDYIDNEDDSE